MILPSPITVSNIGKGIQGNGWRDKWVFADEGLIFIPGTDDLDPGGQGTYQNYVRDLKLSSAQNNTGKAVYVGGPSATHNGDYFEAQRVMVAGAQTAFHFHGIANVTFNQVYITNPVDARGDFGLRVTGGSSNSFHLASTTIANCGVGLSFESPGAGNVVYLGDIGECDVAIKLSGDGSRLIVIGGNIEATCGKVAEVAANCMLILIGTTGHGTFQQPPIDLSPGNGTSRLARYFSSFATTDGVQVIGAGYGNTASHGSRDADERFDATSRTFTGGDFPLYRASLGTPGRLQLVQTANQPNPGSVIDPETGEPFGKAIYGEARDVIRDSSGHGGRVRVSIDNSGNYFHDWLCKEIP